MTGLLARSVSKGDSIPPLEVTVSARTVVMGASASRDWQPQHHDHQWAREKQGSEIFLNTPNQAGWIERYLTAWAGPTARLGKMRFRMRRSIEAGHRLQLRGRVVQKVADDSGCAWIDVSVDLLVNDEVMTEAAVRLAFPSTDDDNPWMRRGDAWRPAAAGDLTL